MRNSVFRSLGTALAVIVPAGAGLAAGPALANPLAPIWSGAYVGLDAGAAWSDVEGQSFASLDRTRATFGGHAGYDLAVGPFVIGVEADARHVGGSTTLFLIGGGTATFAADWAGSVRLRAGTTLGPVLLYATAGWAWTSATVTQQSLTGGGADTRANSVLNGAVYGLGAEGYVLPSVTVRLELLRTDYATFEPTLAGGLKSLRDIDHGDTVVRAGLSLHFN